jgi:hypothetical protein
MGYVVPTIWGSIVLRRAGLSDNPGIQTRSRLPEPQAPGSDPLPKL